MQLNFAGSRTAAQRDVHCTGTLRNSDAAAAQRVKGAEDLLRGHSEGGSLPWSLRMLHMAGLGAEPVLRHAPSQG